MHQFTIYKTFRKVCPHPSNNLLDNASVRFVRLNHKKSSTENLFPPWVSAVHSLLTTTWFSKFTQTCLCGEWEDPSWERFIDIQQTQGLAFRARIISRVESAHTDHWLSSTTASNQLDVTTQSEKLKWCDLKLEASWKKIWRINIIEGHHKR